MHLVLYLMLLLFSYVSTCASVPMSISLENTLRVRNQRKKDDMKLAKCVYAGYGAYAGVGFGGGGYGGYGGGYGGRYGGGYG